MVKASRFKKLQNNDAAALIFYLVKKEMLESLVVINALKSTPE